MSAARQLKLMADYECFPLWESQEGPALNLDPADLPISAALQADLTAWADRYDDTLDRDDPISSGFASAADERAFADDGAALAARLQAELGLGWTVTYQP